LAFVTSYLPSAARNLGLDEMIAHDERYDYEIADEFLAAACALWEGSRPDDAFSCASISVWCSWRR
jgi:alkanesulfonate monooxygenase SsuD/methylene tetrahydromethanopterin reductase-like flavin-dependent oxidoreductase (luciferase family)